MRAPLFLLCFLHLSHAFSAASALEEQFSQLAHVFLKEDLFHTHLKSGFVNTSISPCDNFYRRVCPRGVPAEAFIWDKILSSSITFLDDKNFMSLFPEFPMRTKYIDFSAEQDPNIFLTLNNTVNALEKISIDTLLYLLENVLEKEEDEYNMIFGLKRDIQKISGNLLRKAYHHKKDDMLHAFANKIQSFVSTEKRGWKVWSNSSSAHNHFKKMINNFEIVLTTERALITLVQRENVDVHGARQKTETILSNIIEEYMTSINKAPWGSNEGRFGYTSKTILTTYIKKLSYAVAFANRFSIPDRTKDSLFAKYNQIFLDQYQMLSDMAHMPAFRVFCAKFIAMIKAFNEYPGNYRMKFYRNKPFTFDAFANPEFSWSNPMILMTQTFTIHTALTAQPASMIAFTGFVFAHEMYHQIQFAHKIIEDRSFHMQGKECVIGHTFRVCSRFTEKACSSGISESEDSPDVYGIQIVFKVLQKMLKGDLDKIVFPDLNMTNRELFYHTIAAANCNHDSRAQWLFQYKDTHSGFMYRVNGMLGQLADFKNTFACYEDDLMVFPEKSMCPVFSKDLARRK